MQETFGQPFRRGRRPAPSTGQPFRRGQSAEQDPAEHSDTRAEHSLGTSSKPSASGSGSESPPAAEKQHDREASKRQEAGKSAPATQKTPADAAGNVERAAASAPEAAGTGSEQWREQHLAEAIAALERELNANPLDEREKARLNAKLGLLCLVAGRVEDSLQRVEHLDETEREYWSDQLYALRVLLEAQGTPTAGRRSVLALRHLRDAVGHLATASGLDLRNLAFCTQVGSYGCLTQFDACKFQSSQEVLLYVEVDNFTIEEKPDGFETELRGGYQVFDSTGRRVAEQELPLDKQVCRNRRRDYFIAYRIYMPKSIPPGPYRLQLTIEDVKGSKFGQASVDFEITP